MWTFDAARIARFLAPSLAALMALGAPAMAEPLDDLALQLQGAGLENLAFAEDGEGITVWFESRRHYSRNRAIGLVLTEASRLCPEATLRVIPLVHQVPITTVSVRASDMRSWTDGALSDAELGARLAFSDPLAPPELSASSLAKVDLQLFPGFDIYGSKGFRYLLVEKVSATLMPGVSGLARTEVSIGELADSRWSYGVLRWGKWLAPQTMFTATTGSYSPGEWGWGLELARYWDEGQTALRLGMGDSTMVLPQALVSMERYIPPLDTTLSAGYGRFFLGDHGPFARATRLFARSFLQIEAFSTRLGNQLRFTLGFNFGPDPLPDPAPLRVYGLGWMESEYRASRPRAGNTLWPEANSNDLLQRLLPAYIRTHVGEWRGPG